MPGNPAAKRYAQAAMDLAVRDGAVARWRTDLGDIATLLSESQLAGYLADGKVALEPRLAALERVLDVQPLALNLAKLLVAKGRSREAADVAESFGRMADAQSGIVEAEIATAVALSAEQVAAIQQRLGPALGGTVRVHTTVHPELIGGLVVRVGDKLVDGSVRTRLKQLRRELAGG